MSASRVMPRLVGVRSADMRRTKIPPATAATYATNRDLTTPPDAKGQTHGSGGGGVSARVPGVRRRYSADRVTPKPGPVTKRLPAGAGPCRTGGSQAGEGQDGFAPRTAAPPPVSPARGPPTDWGELVQAHDDRAIFQASPDELPDIDIHSL